MKIGNINKEYINLVINNQNNYKDDYLETVEKVANSNAQYKGKPVPFLYHPMFFTEKDIESFEKITEMIMKITNKITDRFLVDEKFRSKFRYPEFLNELIAIDNGYDINAPIGRFDIFYKDYDNFKFCEINTDGSSAMNEDNIVARILSEAKAFKDFSKEYEMEYFELLDSWVKESIKIYDRYDKKVERPNVAIVDFVESGTPNEFEDFKNLYIRNGYNCIIADPRELKYKEGKLYKDDYKIDLIYRRIVTFELVDKIDEIGDFIQAYKDRAVCVIGSIRSQIMHNKIIFSILLEDDTLEQLSEDEREFIKKHIPYTKIFAENEKIFHEVLNNKDKYIMKPMDLNASQGVFAGRDLNNKEWETRINDVWGKDYICQEFVEPYRRDFLVYKNNDFTTEALGSIVGLFLYNEKFKGLYTRVGPKSIISGLSDYYTVPNFLVRNK